MAHQAVHPQQRFTEAPSDPPAPHMVWIPEGDL